MFIVGGLYAAAAFDTGSKFTALCVQTWSYFASISKYNLVDLEYIFNNIHNYRLTMYEDTKIFNIKVDTTANMITPKENRGEWKFMIWQQMFITL